jgi:hypothetical protein
VSSLAFLHKRSSGVSSGQRPIPRMHLSLFARAVAGEPKPEAPPPPPGPVRLGGTTATHADPMAVSRHSQALLPPWAASNAAFGSIRPTCRFRITCLWHISFRHLSEKGETFTSRVVPNRRPTEAASRSTPRKQQLCCVSLMTVSGRVGSEQSAASR